MKPQAPPPFDHRTRRRIQRRLNEAGGPYGAVELSTDLKLKLSEVLYHAGVLAKWRAAKEHRGRAGHASVSYESLVTDHSDVTLLLDNTRAEDED